MLQAGIRCSARKPRLPILHQTSISNTRHAFSPRLRTYSSELSPSDASPEASSTTTSGEPSSPPHPSTPPLKDSDPSTTPPTTTSKWKPPKLPKPPFPKRTICIKGWTSFADTAEVLAVIRTVEEKYGPVLDYMVSRDYEMPEKPFALIFAALANADAFHLVPANGIEIAVPAPSYRPRAGGPGWKDVEGLLGEGRLDPEFDRKHDFASAKGSGQKYVYVRVSPSIKELHSPYLPIPNSPSPEMQRQVAERFVRWAEAQPLLPISTEAVIMEQDLFGNTEVDNVRKALRWAARAAGREVVPHEVAPAVKEGGEDVEEGTCRSESN